MAQNGSHVDALGCILALQSFGVYRDENITMFDVPILTRNPPTRPVQVDVCSSLGGGLPNNVFQGGREQRQRSSGRCQREVTAVEYRLV